MAYAAGVVFCVLIYVWSLAVWLIGNGGGGGGYCMWRLVSTAELAKFAHAQFVKMTEESDSL